MFCRTGRIQHTTLPKSSTAGRLAWFFSLFPCALWSLQLTCVCMHYIYIFFLCSYCCCAKELLAFLSTDPFSSFFLSFFFFFFFTNECRKNANLPSWLPPDAASDNKIRQFFMSGKSLSGRLALSQTRCLIGDLSFVICPCEGPILYAWYHISVVICKWEGRSVSPTKNLCSIRKLSRTCLDFARIFIC